MLLVDTMAREILVGDGADSVSVWEGNFVCGLSIVSFYFIGKLLKEYGKPSFVSKDIEFWKWQNIAVSWVHGLLCGTWDLLWYVLLWCFLLNKKKSLSNAVQLFCFLFFCFLFFFYLNCLILVKCAH